MMTHQQWLTRTNAGFWYTRGKELKAIDKALSKYLGTRTNTNLQLLETALNTWKRIKGRGDEWTQSVRNSRNTVATLTLEIAAEALNFVVTAPTTTTRRPPPPPPRGVVTQPIPARRPHLPPPPPPPRPYVAPLPASRHNITDGEGHHYTVFAQQETMSCGPACVKIVLKLCGTELGEDWLRDYVAEVEASSHIRSHNWAATGTYATTMTELLNNAAKSTRSAIRGVSGSERDLLTVGSKPAIALVQWSGGYGGHFIVIVRRARSGNRMLILDPYFASEVQSVNIIRSGGSERLDVYRPNGSGDSGVFDDWACKVI